MTAHPLPPPAFAPARKREIRVLVSTFSTLPGKLLVLGGLIGTSVSPLARVGAGV